jgi:hypothetical protein
MDGATHCELRPVAVDAALTKRRRLVVYTAVKALLRAEIFAEFPTNTAAASRHC